MKALLLDDEPFALEYMQRLCVAVPHLEIAAAFCDASEALDYLEKHGVDLVITDIEMPGLTGIGAVKQIRDIRPETGVIFVTGYEEYALQAFQLEAVAYLLKPCSLAELQSAVKKAERLSVGQKRVKITTFGYFAVSVDGVPVRFANSKAKELLALLIDRVGGIVTMEQAIDLLWEERPYDDTVKRLYRKAVIYLNKTFEGMGFFVSDRGSCHIVPSAAECDYFQVLGNPSDAERLYGEEYMLEYDWAEATNGKIARLTEKTSK